MDSKYHNLIDDSRLYILGGTDVTAKEVNAQVLWEIDVFQENAEWKQYVISDQHLEMPSNNLSVKLILDALSRHTLNLV